MTSFFRVISSTLLFSLLFATIGIAQTSANSEVLICYNCSYPEARAAVTEKFQDIAACQYRQANGNAENECEPLPKQFSIYNLTAEEMFSFALSINKTFAELSSGVLKIEDNQLDLSTYTKFRDAWKLYRLIDSTQRKLMSDFSSHNITAPMTDYIYPPDSGVKTNQNLTRFEQYCVTQPGHMAVYMAFADTFTEHLEAKLNAVYLDFLQSAEAREFLDRITIEDFSPSQFITLHSGDRIHMQFPSPRYLPFIRFEFGHPRSQNTIEDELSSVFYTVTPNHHADALKLRINPRLTRMGGWGPGAMAPASANAREPTMYDSCVIEALNAHFAYIKQRGDGSLHSHNGFPDEETVQAQLYRREDGTLVRASNVDGHCRLTYFDEGFERRLTMHVPCD